jgi:hypothetical protein
VNASQQQAFREIIKRNRVELGTDELYILAPGLGEDAIVGGVPIYGDIVTSIEGYPPGSCIVMTRQTWIENLAVLGPALATLGRGNV